MELPERLFTSIEALSEIGNEFADQGRLGEAVSQWANALSLLPDPKADWEAYTWLSASIGDARYQLGQFEQARHDFYDALNGPDGLENPFIHYRLGQCLIKLGDREAGLNSLFKAYMLDGENIFIEDESEGMLMLAILKERGLT